ncbi:MAG: packaged DNA stabilization protein [Sneathiella sp.]|uniref:packaged DNA stabilization protein n=1 Tax=Sneathiella sp. TaxID=1964365 RepID=UPI0030030CC3
MGRVPFPLGFDGVKEIPSTRRTLKNCFNNGEGLIFQRPGIETISTPGGVSRGTFVWNGFHYVVSSNDLLRIDNVETGSYTNVGTIAGTAQIKADVAFNQAGIVVKGGANYTLDKSDVLVDVSGFPFFQPCVDVTVINHRHVWIPANGDPAFYSDVGDASSIQAESFFDAEELPDANRAAWNLRNTLGIGGSNSIEFFRDTGAATAPFRRVSGARVLAGVIGGHIEYEDTIAFVGRKKDQGPGIYSLSGGGAPLKLSNEAVDEILNQYSEAELADTIANRMVDRYGHDILTMTFKRHSLGFFKGAWFEMDSRVGDIQKPWAGGFIRQIEGTYYSSYRGSFGKLSAVNTDFGERMLRVIDMGFEKEMLDYFTCHSIELGIGQGGNSVAGSVALMMSRDNVNYGQPFFNSLGALGEYAARLRWKYPGGLGRYNGFMGMRLYCTEDINFSCSYLKAELK